MFTVVIKKDNTITNYAEFKLIAECEAWVQENAEYFPDGYVAEIIDITLQRQAEKESQEALAYLASTDWLVVRKAETGLDYSQEIKDARAAARLKVL